MGCDKTVQLERWHQKIFAFWIIAHFVPDIVFDITPVPPCNLEVTAVKRVTAVSIVQAFSQSCSTILEWTWTHRSCSFMNHSTILVWHWRRVNLLPCSWKLNSSWIRLNDSCIFMKRTYHSLTTVHEPFMNGSTIFWPGKSSPLTLISFKLHLYSSLFHSTRVPSCAHRTFKITTLFSVGCWPSGLVLWSKKWVSL